MPSRRNLLKVLGGISLLPFAGNIVLANPMVLNPTGVVPELDLLNPTPDAPLLLATDVRPNIVEPILAYVNDAAIDIRYSTRHLADIRGGATFTQLANVRGTLINMRLDISVLPQMVTAEQLDTIFQPVGASANRRPIRLYVEPVPEPSGG